MIENNNDYKTWENRIRKNLVNNLEKYLSRKIHEWQKTCHFFCF